MATLLLSAVGASIGAGFGGTVLGLSGAVIGRAVGATLGRVIDQRVMGAGADPVEVGRIERFRLTGASEGAAVARAWGRVRLGGQVIWATRFQENATRSGGGKGGSRPRTVQYSYSVSLAIALCEGEVRRVGRIWADGNEIDPGKLNLRLYPGSETQMPDPKIAAVEGAGLAPAYRGTAYVVIEDLDLAAFGNRVPQFSFEVVRAAPTLAAGATRELAATVPGVCLIPGTGEYALATTPVRYETDPGNSRSANVNTPGDRTDFAVSLDQLTEELPDATQVNLVVSWFGDDLRCGVCRIRPKVEQATVDGTGMPWHVSGLTRGTAQVLAQLEGRSVYGGTPADASVIEAIAALKAAGRDVTFYPFILMEQLAGNGLPDPWTGDPDQPQLPWRGRITASVAPGRPGTPDRTAAVEAEVAAFFGAAQPAHFTVTPGQVAYSGPDDWGYRRFILHQAALCAAAGGVESFCIGSEMRGLTSLRGPDDSFPAVAALCQLAADVRLLLGPSCQISYAADWSEYFGHHADGNVYFHLDPLWAHPEIGFVGIDNYMPLSDWREGDAHADAPWGAIHNPDYLLANVAGGEGFDWFYASPEAEAAQIRTPITDAEWGEDWVWRYKDLAGWWQNFHHNRIGGARAAQPTAWVPQSKPIRFTEFGCAAIDKGTNQPNRFLAPKSSESGLPKYSTGQRDDLLQMAYFTAHARHWADPAKNPHSAIYDGPMLDYARSTAWAWDARPFPAFPLHQALWSDGADYHGGHWLNGRAASQPLAQVLAEITQGAGLTAVDVSAAHGLVRGYGLGEGATARAALQPLLLAGGVDPVAQGDRLVFLPRAAGPATPLDPAALALAEDLDAGLERQRRGEGEATGRLRLAYVEAEGAFAIRAVEAAWPDATGQGADDSELALALTGSEAAAIAQRWLVEAELARDTLRLALPPSRRDLGPGRVVALDGALWRIDRVDSGPAHLVEAVRIDPGAYRPPVLQPDLPVWQPVQAPQPVLPVFLDLPLMTGDEVPHAPHLAVSQQPWPGPVALWSAPVDDGYVLNGTFDLPALVGVTETDLPAAPAGRWDNGAALRLRLFSGHLSAADPAAVLAGANVLAIGDGVSDTWEILQFAEAVMVAPGTFDISRRLRGQFGSDGVMPTLWPAGSRVVVLDGAARQIILPASARGIVRHYRLAAAGRDYAAPEAVHVTRAFRGNGLRPYAPCHLRAVWQGADIALRWTRRSRIDGDTWEAPDIPLGEEAEVYSVQVWSGSTKLRETQVTAPAFVYSAAQQAADGLVGACEIRVAQISAAYGPGPARSVVVA